MPEKTLKNLKETKEENKMLKNKNGITLVALVVTIVVLLILAGVSINLVVNQNGIIRKGKEAKNANKAATIKEELSLWEADKFASDNGAGTHESMDDFLTRLKNKGLISEDDIQVINDTRKLQVGKETIEFPSSAKTLVQAFLDGELKVGDYLNYNDYVDESKKTTTPTNENGWMDQTYIATKTTSWQILGLNESGNQLMLISQSPIKKEMQTNETSKKYLDTNPYLCLKGAYGYVNCKNMLNNICSIYDTSIGNAKSITIEEINRLMGVTVDYNNKVVYENKVPNTNIDKIGRLGTEYTYTTNDYTPDGYINNKTKATGTGSVTTNLYCYEWGNLSANDTLKTLLFSGTTDSDYNTKAYWLASNAIGVFNSSTNFGPGFVSSGNVNAGAGLYKANGDWFLSYYAVRPIIYIKTNATIEDLHVVDASEDDWKGYGIGMILDGSGNADNGEAGKDGALSITQ